MPAPSARLVAVLQGASIALLFAAPALYVASFVLRDLQPLVRWGACAVLVVAGIVVGSASIFANWLRKS